MTKPLLLSAFLALGISAAAQAPIERRPPEPPPLPTINIWPPTGAIAARTKLIVTLRADYGRSHLCRLRSVTPDTLECEGRHRSSPTTLYSRAGIDSLALIHAHVSPTTFFLGAAATVLTVGLCIDSGGLVLIGLMIAGVTASTIDAHPFFYQPAPPLPPPPGRLIYLAPNSY